MSKLVWLASYPKSGNTWFRIFLTNFFHNSSSPADINALDLRSSAAGRVEIDAALGVECSDLTGDEIDCFRPEAYRIIARSYADTTYFKVHDAYTFNSRSEPLFPADISLGAIYFARNPLDVCISFAHHDGKPVDRTIDEMSRSDRALHANPRHLDVQLNQPLLSWSEHVLSWLDQSAIPIHLMHYEEMSLRPFEVFMAAVRFLGLPEDPDRVRRALEFSSFQRLREQELSAGFNEKPGGAESFFRKGKAGGWVDTLTEPQVGRIVLDHGPVMRRLGYLSSDGRLAQGERISSLV